jgi:sigma-B regulation protein RsbU (phosphoserine phosphatase)
VLGAFDGVPFEEGQVNFSDGDLLVVYSDGITEARSATGEEYGEGRLVELITKHRADTAENIRTHILESVEAWAGQSERGDDQTVVILKAAAGGG